MWVASIYSRYSLSASNPLLAVDELVGEFGK
jgi:hypothetical protein